MAVSEIEIKDLKEKAYQLRKAIISITKWAGGAHIGGALSMVEILIILYFKYLNIDPLNPANQKRDRVILSKGHGGVGHAAILAQKGYFDFELLKTFNRFKSPFGMHLDCLKVPGVDVSTGSLGHGLSIGVGLALGARLQKESWLTYCILGDGECNEGSIWEAAMSASHFKVTNMLTIIDRNRLMIDGKTEDIMGLEPFADKWKSFGFIVKEVDGHNFKELAEAIDFSHNQNTGPVVVIANTQKGRGVDYMEDNVKWHYGSINSTLADQAIESLKK